MQKNIFIVGLDDFNLGKLETIQNADQYHFHPLFYRDEIQGPNAPSLQELLAVGEEKLRAFSGSIDAVTGYWDFPVTDMVPCLAEKFNLPAPSLSSVVKCEHKCWSRIEQRKAIPEHVPDFQCFDPFDPHAADNIRLPYPYWIKPIKSTDSQLGFRIRNRQELEESLKIIRKWIFQFAKPFNHLLERLDLPDEVNTIDGSCCIAEKIISGRQCTVEGYVHDGVPQVYGIIDSFRYPGISSFLRYQYPSRLPGRIREKLADLSKRVVSRIGLNQSAFNIEYFFDKPNDRIWLLEINPRISQSHSDIFEKVDGASNHQIMVSLALGEKPDFPFRRGRFNCAAKFYLRVFEDGTIARTPSEEEINRIKQMFPGTIIRVLVKEGDRLSDLSGQDSYSYALAQIYIGARNTRELLRKFTECRNLLPFRFVEKQPKLAPLGEIH